MYTINGFYKKHLTIEHLDNDEKSYIDNIILERVNLVYTYFEDLIKVLSNYTNITISKQNEFFNYKLENINSKINDVLKIIGIDVNDTWTNVDINQINWLNIRFSDDNKIKIKIINPPFEDNVQYKIRIKVNSLNSDEYIKPNFSITPSTSCENLNDDEARCYLDNYEDLQLNYGNDINQAKLHWKNTGCHEGRTHLCNFKFPTGITNSSTPSAYPDIPFTTFPTWDESIKDMMKYRINQKTNAMKDQIPFAEEQKRLTKLYWEQIRCSLDSSYCNYPTPSSYFPPLPGPLPGPLPEHGHSTGHLPESTNVPLPAYLDNTPSLNDYVDNTPNSILWGNNIFSNLELINSSNKFDNYKDFYVINLKSINSNSWISKKKYINGYPRTSPNHSSPYAEITSVIDKDGNQNNIYGEYLQFNTKYLDNTYIIKRIDVYINIGLNGLYPNSEGYPIQYNIVGSNDKINWYSIASSLGSINNIINNEYYIININDNTPYSYFRFIITRINGPNSEYASLNSIILYGYTDFNINIPDSDTTGKMKNIELKCNLNNLPNKIVINQGKTKEYTYDLNPNCKSLYSNSDKVDFDFQILKRYEKPIVETFENKFTANGSYINSPNRIKNIFDKIKKSKNNLQKYFKIIKTFKSKFNESYIDLTNRIKNNNYKVKKSKNNLQKYPKIIEPLVIIPNEQAQHQAAEDAAGSSTASNSATNEITSADLDNIKDELEIEIEDNKQHIQQNLKDISDNIKDIEDINLFLNKLKDDVQFKSIISALGFVKIEDIKNVVDLDYYNTFNNNFIFKDIIIDIRENVYDNNLYEDLNYKLKSILKDIDEINTNVNITKDDINNNLKNINIALDYNIRNRNNIAENKSDVSKNSEDIDQINTILDRINNDALFKQKLIDLGFINKDNSLKLRELESGKISSQFKLLE